MATVDYATEKAKVCFPSFVSPEATGATDGTAPDAVDSLRQRVTVSAALSTPVVLLAMVPALQFTYRQWLS